MVPQAGMVVDTCKLFEDRIGLIPTVTELLETTVLSIGLSTGLNQAKPSRRRPVL